METDIPEFDDFIEKLAEKYNEHRPEKGDSWIHCSIDFLYGKLQEEFDEVMSLPGYSKERVEELLDLALVSFMCWGRAQRCL